MDIWLFLSETLEITYGLNSIPREYINKLRMRNDKRKLRSKMTLKQYNPYMIID